MRKLSLLVSTMLLMAATTTASAQDAQAQLWDGSIRGDTAVIAKALTAGAKIDSLDTRRNPNGRLALNWAAYANHAAAVRLLIAKGAPLEATNLTGFTALHHAAEGGAMDVVRILLAAGANPLHANKHGMTPASTARALRHDVVADVIEAAERTIKP